MTSPHEVRPHGVPTYWSWAKVPFIRPGAAPSTFKAFTGWGQVYTCAGSAYDPDDIIEMSEMQTWMLRNGVWTRLQYDSNLSGSAFHEDFTGSAAAPYVVSRGATATKIRMRDGYNFHFWPAAGRASWSPSVTSIVVMVKARLIGQGTRAGCVGLSVGGDYWRTLSGGTNTSTDVTGAAVGRFKRVDGQWRVFSMTITPEALASNSLTVPFAAAALR